MAEHIAQRGEAVLQVVIDLPGEVADGDASLYGRADARRKPAREQQRGQRGDQHGDREPEVDVALQRRQQCRRARDDEVRLLHGSRTIDGIDVRQRQLTHDEHSRIGCSGIVRQPQGNPQFGVTSKA